MFVSDIIYKELNSLVFYENIDVNNNHLEDDLHWNVNKEYVIDNLFDLQSIDKLTYKFLIRDKPFLANIANELKNLSIQYSKKYFDLISDRSNELELKLKCQRINYLIQDYLSPSETQTGNCVFIGDEKYYPWDIEMMPDGLLALESKDCVKLNNNVLEDLSKKGFMFTQADQFANKIFFNSCYSDFYVMSDSDLSFFDIIKDSSIIFCFFTINGIYIIDKKNNLIHNNKIIKYLNGLNQPWRFRLKENLLFIFDWSKISSFLLVDLNNLMVERIELKQMLIPHDVEIINNTYCFLDKQQGYLFFYDKAFNFLETKLSFGYSLGKLSDPIGIKSNKEDLIISSWLSGKTQRCKINND